MKLPIPPKGRKLGLNIVALTKFREPRFTMECMAKVREEIEDVMTTSDFLSGAPFSWITLSVSFGLKNDEQPTFGRISKKYGDLPLSIEINVRELVDAEPTEFANRLRLAVLTALLAAGRMYDRPLDGLQRLASADCLSSSGWVN